MIHRRLFNVATAVSLIVCVAAMIGWLRSRQHRDAYRFQRHSAAYAIASVDGQIVIDNEPQRADFAHLQHSRSKILSTSTTTEANGIQFHSITVKAYMTPALPPLFSQTVAYYWMIVAATAVLPFVVLFRWAVRGDRARSSACRACGYNLTGNASGVCPECGAQIVKATQAIR